ncbi:MAG: metallophosphoesterase [Bacteroidia bacterium]|nr:metallophosphoesterase [Bacteroidia bacterium]
MVTFTTLLIRMSILCVLLIAIDFYVWQSFKTALLNYPNVNKVVRIVYWIASTAIISTLLFFMIKFDRSGRPNQMVSIAFGFLILITVPKIIIASGLLIEDFIRLTTWLFFKVKNSTSSTGENITVGRKEFISQILLGIAAIPFLGILHGVTIGKYRYKVHKVNLTFKDLPEAFNGFKITQLSDIHSGSFNDKKRVEKGIALANAQKSDIVLFTGDLVNNRAEEMDPWINTFKQLSAPMGKFSSLGNHDYGDYVLWNSGDEKRKNLQAVKDTHPKIGFELLNNQMVKLTKGTDTINIIGIENWGLPPFPQHGKLQEAMLAVQPTDFNILMSHDPSHWDAQAKDFSKHIHLTLAGHTHGMQFGIEIPGFKWSPVKFKYPKWAGLYQHENREKYLYVNRGFGFLGFPGRVGIWPEITVITLNKG